MSQVNRYAKKTSGRSATTAGSLQRGQSLMTIWSQRIREYRSCGEKRISRAKKVLARSKSLFDLSGADDFLRRLPAVQPALYLNELEVRKGHFSVRIRTLVHPMRNR